MKFVLMLLFLSGVSWAQVLDKTVTIENPDGSKISNAELTDQALKKMAEDLIVEYVGAESYNRNKASLTTKVINSAAKFTPFQTVQDVERGPFGVRLTALFKVNLTDFRKLLSDAGLFSKTRIANNVIAFISIEDGDGHRQAMTWKKNENTEYRSWVVNWNEDFKTVFEKAGYGYNKNLNPAWIEGFNENVSAQDVLSRNTLGQSFILWGVGKVIDDSRLKEKVLSVQMKVYSQDYKREVTDSARRFRLKDDSHQKWSNWAQDIVAQLDEVDAKSLTQDAMIKLTFKGALPLMEQETFKQWVLNSSPLIKSVTERRFSSDSIVFEIESDASTQDLAQKLQSLDYKGKKMRTQFGQNEIRMEAVQ